MVPVDKGLEIARKAFVFNIIIGLAPQFQLFETDDVRTRNTPNSLLREGLNQPLVSLVPYFLDAILLICSLTIILSIRYLKTVL